MSRLAVALLVGLTLLPRVGAAESLEEQAARQLTFAEEELTAGQFERALKSAESAQRLSPNLYGAFVVKALAYEGLGNTELAKSLLLAYLEVTSGLSSDPRVQPALDRLRATPEPGEGRGVVPEGEGSGATTVRLLDTCSGCAVSLRTPDGQVELAVGENAHAAAPDAVAVVTSRYGRQEVPLPMEPGGVVEFDPAPWVSSALVVEGLPTGSSVRVSVEGIGGPTTERTHTVPPRPGTLDPSTGVMVAPPQRLGSLLGDTASLVVAHPVLGDGTLSVELEPSNVSKTTFEWRSLTGVPGVQRAFADWSSRRSSIQRQVRPGAGLSLGIGAAGGIASGVLFAVAASLAAQADGAKSLALTAASSEPVDLAGVERYQQDYDAAVQARPGVIAAGAVSAGVAGVGLTVGIVIGGRGEARLKALGAWDPNSPQKR